MSNVGRRQKFSDEIRQAVRDSGMSHRDICKKMRLNDAAMSRFMSGQAGLGLKALDRLAVVLELHIRKGK